MKQLQQGSETAMHSKTNGIVSKQVRLRTKFSSEIFVKLNSCCFAKSQHYFSSISHSLKHLPPMQLIMFSVWQLYHGFKMDEIFLSEEESNDLNSMNLDDLNDSRITTNLE